jgi:hypothetical protein
MNKKEVRLADCGKYISVLVSPITYENLRRIAFIQKTAVGTLCTYILDKHCDSYPVDIQLVKREETE